MSIILPKIIGYRGAKAYAPENTLVSFHMAADMGVEWISCNVKLTKDGEPVIFHDDILDRTTNGTGKISDITYQDLQELDAGAWFNDSFVNTKIPHLEDALTLFMERGLGVNLEITACKGRETETAEITLDITSRIWGDDIAPPLISSFDILSLESSFDMAPEWPRGLIIDEDNDKNVEDWLKNAEYLEVKTIHCNGNIATNENIKDYLDTKLPIICYTINDQIKAQALFDLGVNSVCTDVADVIFDAIETYH